MSDWVWVPLAALYVVHDRQIARHGGAPGTRDPALLEMGCTRAINRASYEEADVFAIAAAYAFGITKVHAFVDGNKRTAFVAAFAFLRLNGVPLKPDPGLGVRMMEELASGQVSEDAFAAWLKDLASQADLI
ncbi:type II toxin-antitoxin system death-on-curing family toxin [Sulfitobacter pseudonitzschiae]|uniref:Type II toxin-antitoxin system death-on-curing family toxin n=1 Tax=Pseudosulfitobacter pseudonitzschiae TaxID=1402135 RepID=A0A9Q2NRH0_9RHOB|nr:type II toxin-antitoxin system death-on-curing family toxin [Pseudosulfitobacter pseudonitzschiae]MBM2295027.1 type II toxin-antitoxin system death-on-curing family toxin [Pseudosulfitobacter pseudonitzschiae]MBM2299929.1 type II toxin-antitoxin system death-on-curing family toxin [Pseudosulfitobacter pseudonitzschiae]MBM2304865.1 type II toxin-antitoxin system death-on-curing family toxin [Pseudosulfitobacter pseudonitzschiae]MBM2314638.1 type II toxin-antitoxin system death-on-curing famil